MTLLQCEKNRCTVPRNIIDVIKMIEARFFLTMKNGHKHETFECVF